MFLAVHWSIDSLPMERRKEKCNECKKDVERKEVIKHPDHDEVVLACGHKYRFFTREIVENINLSEKVKVNIIKTLNEACGTSTQ